MLPRVGVQAPGQQALLGVQPVFRLVEHHRLRPVHHLVGDFLAAMRRQAMHEQRVGLGLGHQPGIDLIALEHVVPRLGVAVAHRHPGVGDDAVGILDRLFRVLADLDRGARRLHPVHQPFLGAQFGRRRHPQLEVEALGRVHPGRQHIVGIAGPGHRAAADRPALFLEGHHVGQHLAGMRAPRQPVDHRHRGMAREFGHRLVVEDADHDRVDIARQHARGVGQRLAAAELHFLRGQQHRLAAELAHGDVERYARAGRRLVEDHRQRLAGQRRTSTPPRARAAFMARLLSIIPASTGFGISMRSRKCRTPFPVMTPPPACRARGCVARQPRAGAIDARDRLGDFVLADDQRRQQPHHIVAGGDRDHLLGAQFVDHLGDRRHHAQADQQAFAAHLGDHRGVAILEFRQPLLEQPAKSARTRSRKPSAGHHVDHRIADRHRQRIAAEGRAMRAGGHALAGFRRRQTGADRKAAAERLGDGHDVGSDPGMLISEQIAGAANAGLDLVEDQQQAVVVAQLAQRAQKCVRHDAHAALAHHRLDQDGGGLGPDGLLDRIEIGERHLVEARHRRAEAVEIFLVAGRGQRRQRAAVEGALEGDDAEPLGLAAGGLIFARHLDRALDRLGAGILKKHRVGKGRRAQPVGQPFAFRNAIEIRDVPDLLRLLGQRLDQIGMRMAERVDGDAGGEIEVALARGRDQPGALAPLESEVDARISRQ